MGDEPTLLVQRTEGVLYVTLNQPAQRNALSGRMVQELRAVAHACAADAGIRCVVLRGAGGNFCAGGNLADFQQMMRSEAATPDPIALANREFGSMLREWSTLPQVVIAVVEGAAMGGGFGLVAISDIAIADAGARFAMPEASLGLPPAQIAPFVAQRIGDAATRRLALMAERIDAGEARALGLIHTIVLDQPALEQALRDTLGAVLRCAPGALASTKAILARRAMGAAMDATLDFAAQEFAHALRNGDAAEGVRAYADKRAPAWVRKAELPT